ncbi:uncharacterized protein [Haliotis cracherodii]|uniref:uncharacterized protein n=1 Tax=Haliotis cracherodii TaxID=6455 RepID=UPI0039EA7383
MEKTLILLCLILVTAGASAFEIPKIVERFRFPSPNRQTSLSWPSGSKQETLESDMATMNSSVSNLTKHVHELEKDREDKNRAVDEKMEATQKEQAKLGQKMESLSSSLNNFTSTVRRQQHEMQQLVESVNLRTDHIEDVMKKASEEKRAHTNLALNKPTKSSSTFPGSHHENLVDGSPYLDWKSGSCFASTSADQIPWWQVDLENTYSITNVKVSTRLDFSGDRLHDFNLEVFSDDPTINTEAQSRMCYFHKGLVAGLGKTKTIPCTEPVVGRFLRLTSTAKRDRGDLLQLCEVEVFGRDVQ